MEFPTHINDITELFGLINPKLYSKTRNFKDGAVTKLSPYISRGVISTRQVYEHILSLGRPWSEIEKLVQELAWRDYWQQLWIAKRDAIYSDLKHPQNPILNHEIPEAIVNACTGIHAIDAAINEFYTTGYMHNHMRMYVASVCCNITKSHWFIPSKWMYANLLDGDIASNILSWQWVAGTNSNKKYYANQENVNKYFYSNQKNTFLDVDYNDFDTMKVPKELVKTCEFSLQTDLSEFNTHFELVGKRTLIYNYYNLDPHWRKEESVQRVLLLEPSLFQKFPVTKKCLNFILELSKNIKNITFFVGEFDDLIKLVPKNNITYKEHPLNSHYKGTEDSRDWLTETPWNHGSFFSFWKKCKKQLL